MMSYLGGLAATSYGSDDERPPLVLLHGLTFDRRQWEPTLAELDTIDPGRRVVALDLPGHGDSPRRHSYHLDEVATAVHTAVAEAGLDAPLVVGHSAGGLIATAYAVSYPVRGVVNVDQPLQTAAFQELVHRNASVLRSPGYLAFWQGALESMHIELLPAAAQELVRTDTTPRQDLLLGYWDEVLSTEPGRWPSGSTAPSRPYVRRTCRTSTWRAASRTRRTHGGCGAGSRRPRSSCWRPAGTSRIWAIRRSSPSS
jgi:pimeloyl-ACP methyl ester carboxylesterase